MNKIILENYVVFLENNVIKKIVPKAKDFEIWANHIKNEIKKQYV